MQTIKVNTRTNATGSVTTFSVNGKCVAHVGSDFCNLGKYSARFGVHASASNIPTFAHAVEFITDAITAHFAAFGLAVEFTA